MRIRRVLVALSLLAGLVVVGQASPASAADPPTVSSASPSSGGLGGGQVITIKGANFTGATAVKFDTTDATSFAVVSAKVIVAQVPAAATAGAAPIKVTTPDGTNSSGASFTYKNPEIKSVAAASASPTVSSWVTIAGSGFLGAAAADVKFGTIAATAILVVSDSQIVARTPTTAVVEGEVDVTVTRNSVVSATSTKTKFLFTSGLPVVTTLGTVAVPVTGSDGSAPGSLLTITGTDLWAIKQVNFGSTKVTAVADIVVAAGGLTMTVKVPTRSSGPADVTVTNAAGASVVNLKTLFSYYASDAPKITSLSSSVFDKTTTTGGGTFLVTGRGLTGVTASKVTIKCATDITPTSATAVSDTSLVVVIPGNANTAAVCDLEIVNPLDASKKVTSVGAINYI